MTPYETILVETRGRVGWITLNRPEALNALNSQVMWDLVAASKADAAATMSHITCVLRAFSASGRLMVIQPTRPRVSTRIVSYGVMGFSLSCRG